MLQGNSWSRSNLYHIIMCDVMSNVVLQDVSVLILQAMVVNYTGSVLSQWTKTEKQFVMGRTFVPELKSCVSGWLVVALGAT